MVYEAAFLRAFQLDAVCELPVNFLAMKSAAEQVSEVSAAAPLQLAARVFGGSAGRPEARAVKLLPLAMRRQSCHPLCVRRRRSHRTQRQAPSPAHPSLTNPDPGPDQPHPDQATTLSSEAFAHRPGPDHPPSSQVATLSSNAFAH